MKSIKHGLGSIFLLSVIGSLCACGGGGGNGNNDSSLPTSSANAIPSSKSSSSMGNSSSIASDTIMPTAQIMFPTPVSLTEGESILVRGTAADDASSIISVKVNGVEATTIDGYANWQAKVPLVSGINTLAVDVKDSGGNLKLNAATANIASNPALLNSFTPDATLRFSDPVSITLDTTNNRALVLDTAANAESVIAVDLLTGARTQLSQIGVFNAPNGFSSPTDISLDKSNNRALVTDLGLNAVIAIDLTSGAGSVLSNSGNPDNFNNIVSPRAVTVDNANNRALVIQEKLEDILSVNLLTGARSFLTGSPTPNPNNTFFYPFDIVIDNTQNRAIILERVLEAVIAVDLTTGVRTTISNSSTPDTLNKLTDAYGIDLDSANNRALVVKDRDGIGTVIAVDLTTGNRTVLSNNNIPNANNLIYVARSIAVDDAHKRALVVDAGLAAIVAVDLVTGERVYFSK